MATTQSTEVTDIKVNTSLYIKESNESSSNATNDTPSSGLFISPSSNVPGRPSDITGFIVTASNELGKLEFSDSVGFISLNDLSDVTITNVQDEDFLKYDAGTQQWINTSLALTFVTLDGVQTLTNKTMTSSTNNLTSRGVFSDSGSNTVSVFASPNPTSGQVLTATNATTATWQDPAGDVTLNGVQTLTNKTITDNTNDVTARGLFSDSGTNTVSLFTSANPTSGQVITATGATTATWQTPPGGDVTLNGVQTLTNKTMTNNTNDVTSRSLFSNSGTNSISVFASPNPTSGQILTATGATTATWQTPQVTLSGIQAFSNKTMTSNTNNVTARSLFTGSGSGSVSVFAATAPSLGQVLTATGASTATWQTPAGGDVTLNGVQTLTNKTITDNTNDVTSRGMFTGSGTGTLSTYAATAPSSGQILTATSGTTATWQTPQVTLTGSETLTNKTMTDNTNDVNSRALFVNSGAGSVSTFAAAVPSSGQVLTATGASTATWQTPQVTLTGSETLTNKTMTSSSNNVTSRGLFTDTGSGTVSTFAAAAPSNGQVLTATGATTATWQTPSAAAGGSTTEVQFNNAGLLDGISGITTNGSTQLNFADNSLVQFGTGNDLTITHNATNSLITTNTGDLIIENDNVTGSTIHRLGTATNATDFQIQDSANATLFSIDGTGSTLIGGSDETTKFVVEDSSNAAALTVDTTTAETTATSFIATSIISDRVIYVDEKPQNTDSGTFTSGAWRTRTLNTERYSRETTGWVGLSLSNISLVAGTYYIYGSAPAYQIVRHQTRFFNVNDGTTAILGTSEFCINGTAIQTRSFFKGVVTIASAKTFRIEHRCTTTKTNNGFGVPCNFTTEVYAEIEIVRLA